MYRHSARPNITNPTTQGNAPTPNSQGYSGVRSAHAKMSVPITASRLALTMELTVLSRASGAE